MEKKVVKKKKVYMVVVVVAIIAIVIVVWAVWLRGPKVAKIELSVEPSTLVADDKSNCSCYC